MMTMNYLERIIRSQTSDLPVEWQFSEADRKKFSRNKSLYDFQAEALEAACMGLWLHYREDGDSLASLYDTAGARELVDETKANRMGFWMATGSGKTLVIVKLIEMLATLMERGSVPKRDIMFLVYRDDLLDQFQAHVNEYNTSAPRWTINLVELRDYERVKREHATGLIGKSINVFYYRADLFFEKKTAKKVNPASYDNHGEWFVLLDEAHRGDANDSKLRDIYDNFSRNGFLFNFSATFIDAIDKATCAYNFNLEKFINDGYGKNIYVSEENVRGFDRDHDFADHEKQKIVLKTLILQTYINTCLAKVRGSDATLYHKPLLLGIVNRVTEKDSDLRLFFAELEKIAGGKLRDGLFNAAKQALVAEARQGTYLFGGDKVAIDWQQLSKITYQDVLRAVFNTSTSGKIEFTRLPGNSKELVFKMQTSESPFALIRIGDVTTWVKEILRGYHMTERFAGDSVFAQINAPDSPINILMGSRAFYQGWDSNRPNIVLFVNIGVGKDSKKFVLQAVGRGVRIEPVKHKRKRLKNLHLGGKLADKQLFAQIRDAVRPLESLFVFGTNAQNLKSVIETMKGESTGTVFELGSEFAVNPDAQQRTLLVPIYEKSDTLFSETEAKYPISEDDLVGTRELVRRLSDKILVAKYGCDLAVMEKTRAELDDMTAHGEDRTIGKPDLIISRLFDYFSLKGESFSKFDVLGDEYILHFKQIRFSGNQAAYDSLKEKIGIMRDFPAEEARLKASYGKLPAEEYASKQRRLDDAGKFSVSGKEVKLKHLAQHYYHPLLVAEDDIVGHFTHIIRVRSEAVFLQKLEGQIDALTNSHDWWMFSKLDETLDNVYIPYYNPNKNALSKFKPDFIFWLKKGKDYRILFIDPKGDTYAGYQRKADGYEKLFGEVGQEKCFKDHGMNIRVCLRFFRGDLSGVGDKYRPYWTDDITKIFGE